MQLHCEIKWRCFHSKQHGLFLFDKVCSMFNVTYLDFLSMFKGMSRILPTILPFTISIQLYNGIRYRRYEHVLLPHFVMLLHWKQKMDICSYIRIISLWLLQNVFVHLKCVLHFVPFVGQLTRRKKSIATRVLLESYWRGMSQFMQLFHKIFFVPWAYWKGKRAIRRYILSFVTINILVAIQGIYHFHYTRFKFDGDVLDTFVSLKMLFGDVYWHGWYCETSEV